MTTPPMHYTLTGHRTWWGGFRWTLHDEHGPRFHYRTLRKQPPFDLVGALLGGDLDWRPIDADGLDHTAIHRDRPED